MDLLSLSSSSANRHFLRSMARVGAGCEEFFDSKTKSKWERKVKSQLSKAFQPALTSVSVEWQQFDDNAPKPVQVINFCDCGFEFLETHCVILSTGSPRDCFSFQWVKAGSVWFCPQLSPGHTQG